MFWDFFFGRPPFTYRYRKGEVLPVIGQTVPQEWYDKKVKEVEELFIAQIALKEELANTATSLDNAIKAYDQVVDKLTEARRELEEVKAEAHQRHMEAEGIVSVAAEKPKPAARPRKKAGTV